MPGTYTRKPPREPAGAPAYPQAAALIHDPALLDAVTAAAIALRNGRLRAQLRATVVEPRQREPPRAGRPALPALLVACLP